MCVVNSSRNEGTPVAPIEAIAAGVPVVTTAVDGTSDLRRGAPSEPWFHSATRASLVPPRHGVIEPYAG